MELIYFVDNKMGGVTSLNYNLACYPQEDTKQIVIHIHQREWTMTKSDIHFPVDEEHYFEFSGDQHSYQILKELHQLVPQHEGALVLNYENEMAMLDHYPVKQTTYQLVHDSYNVKLAIKYGHIVDVFICHNSIIFEELKKLFPQRLKDIFYLPHGVPVVEKFRKHTNENDSVIKLLFLGRMTSGKGIYDLPVISNLLTERAVKFEWLCIGNGPELDALKNAWGEQPNVRYVSPATNKEVMDLCAEHDVFVLPTKFEGSPVSLLETMSAGLVPVITKLPGGITDIVTSEIGFTPQMDDNVAFANAIEQLSKDRKLLKSLSINCRNKIIDAYDVKQTAKEYHQLFQRYAEFYKHKQLLKKRVGAKLDHPLIPFTLTRFLRTLKSK
jgi:glycosyltransferase involved in cell wall biosynthesis